MKNNLLILISILLLTGISCQEKRVSEINLLTPLEIIDLGTLVTEDLPYQIWGKELMDAFGFEKANHFDVREWEFDFGGGKLTGSNAYYTLFNHGCPHVDAPNHMDLGGGLNVYTIDQFVGPLKVFDVSGYPNGRTVPVEVFKDKVLEGDVVMIYTNYVPPQSEKTPPELISLSFEAAEYLATVPIRAFATDAYSVFCTDTEHPVESNIVSQREAPIHYSFLSRSIPIYEELCNVDKLMTKENMLFIGAPLNIKDGDGMPVRPVALVYE